MFIVFFLIFRSVEVLGEALLLFLEALLQRLVVLGSELVVVLLFELRPLAGRNLAHRLNPKGQVAGGSDKDDRMWLSTSTRADVAPRISIPCAVTRMARTSASVLSTEGWFTPGKTHMHAGLLRSTGLQHQSKPERVHFRNKKGYQNETTQFPFWNDLPRCRRPGAPYL